jgi:cystathionine beta-lyase/cystathionine gamma-synthase
VTEHEFGFETRAIHAGQTPDETTGAVVTPIYQTSTYAQEAVGVHRGYEYSRTANPTRTALERCLASLEGAGSGFAFASGMAAEDAVLRLLPADSHVVIPNDAYGGTYRLVTQVFGPAGMQYSAADLSDPEAIAEAWRPNTRLVWVESPTNPLLGIVDIAAVARLAHERGARCVVDNTFATPYLQQPLALGADIVVHSTTKFLNGHSDSVGGVVVSNSDEIAEKIGFLQNAVGAILSPMDSFLVLRGVKTLAVRMKRHEENGGAMANYLAHHAKVQKINYPGLPDHPQHELAKRQMNGFGALISFELGSYDNAKKFLDRVRLCSLGESLGGVETLISHPETMTHASVPIETRKRLGITPGLVRISVGIEDIEDLIGDLENAFEGV